MFSIHIVGVSFSTWYQWRIVDFHCCSLFFLSSPMAPRIGGGGNQILTAEDSTSHYYLHPSDNLGLQLVSQLLVGSNYINWSRSISTALFSWEKLLFVNGVLLRPHDDDLLYSAWIRCNCMVVSWFRNSIFPQIGSSIMYLDDAHDICAGCFG